MSHRPNRLGRNVPPGVVVFRYSPSGPPLYGELQASKLARSDVIRRPGPASKWNGLLSRAASPPRQAYSHSASVGRRTARPLARIDSLSFWKKSSVSFHDTLSTG